MRCRSAAVVSSGLVLVAAAGAARANPVIACFSAERSPSFSLSAGTEVTQLRARVLAAYPDVQFREVTTISDASLQGANVFFATGLGAGCCQPITPLTAEEQSALVRFVQGGGGAVLLIDNDAALAHDTAQSLIGPFGLTGGGTLSDADTATVVNPAASAVTSGPFGTVTAVPLYYSGWFADLGPNARLIASESQQSLPVVAEITAHALGPASGHVTLIADTNPMWDGGLVLSEQGFSLLLNSIAAGISQPACYANCDASTATPILNVNDFICFQTRFAAGDSYANCDGSTGAPVLNVNDFICFQTRFAAGCP